MPKFIEMTSEPWTKANFRMPPEDNTRSPRAPSSSTGNQNLGSVRINAAAIKFTDSAARGYYNPLYDRQPTPVHPSGLNIEPPQWQKAPYKSEPISYSRGTRATIKLDITGSPPIPDDSSISVRVTPRAELLKRILMEEDNDTLVTDPNPHSITFDPPCRTIQVTDWNQPDYEQLTFTTNALPNEVQLSQLKITWCFEYRYSETDQWFNVPEEITSHETYITYSRPYYKFSPFYRPWKQVLRKACFYAHGATSTISASSMVTTKIYDSLEFSYKSNKSHSDFDNSEIKLWQMLSDGWVDCMDGSNYYTIMMQWLGIPAKQQKISEGPGGFFYNLLRPISTSDNLNAGWEIDHWNFHQVGILTHVYDPIIRTNATVVYDPITMTDKAEGPGIVPTNISSDDYKPAIFESGKFSWDSKALVRRVE